MHYAERYILGCLIIKTSQFSLKQVCDVSEAFTIAHWWGYVYTVQRTDTHKHKSIQVYPESVRYGGRESSTRCNFRKYMQIEKAPANKENIFIILTVDGANAHNTTKKETRCK